MGETTTPRPKWCTHTFYGGSRQAGASCALCGDAPWAPLETARLFENELAALRAALAAEKERADALAQQLDGERDALLRKIDAVMDDRSVYLAERDQYGAAFACEGCGSTPGQEGWEWCGPGEYANGHVDRSGPDPVPCGPVTNKEAARLQAQLAAVREALALVHEEITDPVRQVKGAWRDGFGPVLLSEPCREKVARALGAPDGGGAK